MSNIINIYYTKSKKKNQQLGRVIKIMMSLRVFLLQIKKNYRLKIHLNLCVQKKRLYQVQGDKFTVYLNFIYLFLRFLMKYEFNN